MGEFLRIYVYVCWAQINVDMYERIRHPWYVAITFFALGVGVSKSESPSKELSILIPSGSVYMFLLQYGMRENVSHLAYC